jgi:hypothetical protein
MQSKLLKIKEKQWPRQALKHDYLITTLEIIVEKSLTES